ncbi:type 1 fimbrial protein, partial [Escherichia coli]|nr:type 1 fimbrial protein [Escherichia coli]
MKKSIIAAVVSSAVMVAIMSGAHASTSTTVNITGTVNTTTCDVVANTQNVNLGNATPADFTAINTPVDKTKQTFSLSLQNCNGASAGQAQLKVSGPVSNAGSSYFAKDPVSIVAIGLSQASKGITNGSLLDLGAKGA